MEYKGIGISTGKAIGKLVIIDEFDNMSSNNAINNKNIIIEKVSYLLSTNIKNYENMLDNNESSIINKTCKKIVSSPSFYKKITEFIIDHNYSAIHAIEKTISEKISEIEQLGMKFGDEISKELNNFKNKVINSIIDYTNEKIKGIDYDFVLAGKDITPSMALAADPKHLKGVISERGNSISHVGVICKNLGIPAVVKIKELSNALNNNEIVYIDGKKGIIVNAIDNDTYKKYNEEIEKYNELNKEFEEMIDRPAQTKDKKIFKVTSNIGNIDDIGDVISVRADGVGLLRSEFLYLNRTTPPSEELQYKTYKSFALLLKDKPLIIRTFDTKGDKKVLFDKKDILKTQIRAILRASSYGNIMIMYPMISNIEELRSLNVILREAMTELQDEEILYNKDIKTGITVEVPSVAIMSDMFIDEVDFLSIGTNDLIKYTTAKGNKDSQTEEDEDIFNPAIIRLVTNIIDTKKDGKIISICGEIADNPLYIIILVGLGIDCFSVNVKSILKVKKFISMLSYEECKIVTEHVLTLKTGTKIYEYLQAYAKKVFNVYLEI